LDEELEIKFFNAIRPEEVLKSYWDLVKNLTLQGKLQDALILLDEHSVIKSSSKSEKSQLHLALTMHPLVKLLGLEGDAEPVSVGGRIGDDWVNWRQVTAPVTI
jgi:Nup85 Nucleoporin